MTDNLQDKKSGTDASETNKGKTHSTEAARRLQDTGYLKC